MDILTNLRGKEKEVIHSAILPIIAKIFFAVLIASGFWYITANNFDPDLGWHLRVGEQIVNTGEIPRHDTFSHTMPGFEWIDHEWLVDAWLWRMQDLNLWWLVTAVFATLAFLPFLIWIIRAQRLSWLWIILLGALSAMPFIGIRPQMISFFLFFIVFEMFSALGAKHWRWAVLPVIFFIWANLHGGFITGLILFASFLIAQRIPQALLNWKLWKFNFHRLASNSITMPRAQYNMALISFIASILATLINPYGWKLYDEIFTAITSPYVMKYILEWLSIASSGNIFILVFLALFLALFINYWRQYPIAVLLPTALFFMMGVKSMRNFPLFLIVALPFIFSATEILRRDAIKSQELAPISARIWLALRLVIITLFIIPIAHTGYSMWHKKGENGRYPEKAVSFMEQKIKSGEWDNPTILNDYAQGGYLIWRLPEVKVFIDGRMPHWQDKDGNSAMKDYIAIIRSDDMEEKKNILKKRGVNTIIATNKFEKEVNKNQLLKNNGAARIIKRINGFFYGESNTNLKEELIKDGWDVTYEDRAAIILRHE